MKNNVMSMIQNTLLHTGVLFEQPAQDVCLVAFLKKDYTKLRLLSFHSISFVILRSMILIHSFHSQFPQPSFR